MSGNVVIPPRLQVGDLVGVVSPSWPIAGELHDQLQVGKRCLESMGLKVKLARHALASDGYSAGTRQQRLDDFHEMWSDPQVKMVLMSQGGQTAIHLLDGLDYDLFRRVPKIFAGISDGTTLLNALWARSGLVTYHGPDLLFTFGRRMSERFRRHIQRAFFESHALSYEPNPEWRHESDPTKRHAGWRCIRAGVAEGPLVGGHSGCLCNVLLSGIEAIPQGAILFLEGTDKLYDLDQHLSALHLRGDLAKLSGLVLGWFENYALEESGMTRPVSELVLERCAQYHFPILEIGELGHNVENYVFPIGIRAFLDAKNLSLRLTEPAVL